VGSRLVRSISGLTAVAVASTWGILPACMALCLSGTAHDGHHAPGSSSHAGHRGEPHAVAAHDHHSSDSPQAVESADAGVSAVAAVQADAACCDAAGPVFAESRAPGRAAAHTAADPPSRLAQLLPAASGREISLPGSPPEPQPPARSPLVLRI
jgi:hypothetical protein